MSGETWKLPAILADIFAGLTSVLAKSGLAGISADTGLAIRTTVVFALVLANALAWGSAQELGAITARQGAFGVSDPRPLAELWMERV